MTLTNILSVFLNTGYYLLCCPFRVTFQNPSKLSPVKFALAVSRAQKFSCFVLTFLGSFWTIREGRMSIPTKSRNPALYFACASDWLNSLIKFTVATKFWMNGNDYIQILNYIVTSNASKSSRFSHIWTRKAISFLICILYICIDVSKWITGTGALHKNTWSVAVDSPDYIVLSEWSWKGWWTFLVNTGYSNFYLCQSNLSSEYSSWMDILVGVASGVGLIHRLVFGAFCDLFNLMPVLTLWCASKEFSSLIRESTNYGEGLKIMKGGATWNQIYNKYKSLRGLSGLVNQVLGVNVTLFLVETVLDYAVGFERAFVEETEPGFSRWFKITSLLFFFCGAFPAVLVFSGDICQQVNKINQELIPFIGINCSI